VTGCPAVKPENMSSEKRRDVAASGRGNYFESHELNFLLSIAILC